MDNQIDLDSFEVLFVGLDHTTYTNQNGDRIYITSNPKTHVSEGALFPSNGSKAILLNANDAEYVSATAEQRLACTADSHLSCWGSLCILCGGMGK